MYPQMGQVSKEALALMKTALANPRPGHELAKAGLNVASNITWYDLRAPAMIHVPFLTPLRDMIPRVARPNPGPIAHWKVIEQLVGSGFNSQGWVPEGQRSGVMPISAVDATAAYTTLGEETDVTFEAESSATGLEDANALATFLLLEKTFLKEEIALLGGNKSLALGVPTISATSSPVDATSTLTATTYYIAVVALTIEGKQNSTVAAGVATQKTVTGADGKTYTINGGSSNKSAISTQVVSAGDSLVMTATPKKGAVAYAWYIGTVNAAASLYLQAITTVNTLTLTADPVTTTQTADAITADCSRNNGTGSGTPVTAFDGMLYSSLNASNAYFLDNAGSALTATNAGSIAQIDDMILQMWDSYKVGVSNIWCSAKTAKKLRDLVLTNNSAPLLRFNVSASGDEIAINAGGTIAYYFSPISTYGGAKIPIRVHPNLPDGVIMAYADQLPAWYKSNATPMVAQVLTQRDYYSIAWPQRTRAYEYGTYVQEVLAMYAPFATGIICNFTT